MTGSTTPASTENMMDVADAEVTENFRKTELVPFCIIIAVGVLANLTVIFNGTRKGVRSKHYSNYFILSLAFADLGVVLMAIPINIVEYTGGLDVSQFTCAFILPIRETFQSAAIQSLSVLALARLKHITSPTHMPITKRRSLIIVITIWLNSYLLVSLPLGFIYKTFPGGICNPSYSNPIVQKIHITLTAIYLYLPLIVSTISYVPIINKLRNLYKTTNNAERVTRKSRNLSILLVMLMITCLISSLPLGVYFLLMVYEVVELPTIWWSVIAVLFYSSSAINPILVLLMKKDYRFLLPKLPTRKRRIGNLRNEEQMVIRNPNVVVHK